MKSPKLGEIIKEIMRFLNPSGTVLIITEIDKLLRKRHPMVKSILTAG